MALLTVQTIGVAGVTPSYAASASSDTFTDDGTERTFLQIKNTGTQKVATIVPAKTPGNAPGVGSFTVPTITVTIPATTGDKWIGPFPDAYRDQSGIVTVALDGITGATVAAVKLPKLTT